jgi:hypothetical protein
MASAMIADCFAVLTQGLMYAIGGYFIRRKELAYGTMQAGIKTADSIIPIVKKFLLSTYGFRTTLRVLAIASILLSGPLIYFLRPRLSGLSFLKISHVLGFPDGSHRRELSIFHSQPLLTYLRVIARLISI